MAEDFLRLSLLLLVLLAGPLLLPDGGEAQMPEVGLIGDAYRWGVIFFVTVI